MKDTTQNDIITFTYDLRPDEILPSNNKYSIEVDYVVSPLTGKQTLIAVKMLPGLLAMVKDMKDTYINILWAAAQHCK